MSRVKSQHTELSTKADEAVYTVHGAIRGSSILRFADQLAHAGHSDLFGHDTDVASIAT